MGAAVLLDDTEGTGPSLDAYRRRGGYAAWSRVRDGEDAEALVDLIEASALAGKGGAGFPMHRKLRLMRAQAGNEKLLVLNGSEHEPGSLKDRHLLEVNPHKVVEGALIAARIAGATSIMFGINESSIAAIAALRHAVAEVRADDNVDVAGFPIVVRTVPEVYIVGEETALLDTLEGKPPLPRRKPPFPIQSGYRGLPTLVQNIETVAHLPFIVAHGAVAYRALGPSGKGVTLCSLGDEYLRPGVYEIPLGTSLRTIITEWGGGLRDGAAIKAVQPGGPSAGYLGAADLDLPLDAGVLAAHGSALGCAVVRAYAVDACMVRAVGEVMHFFAEGSCGQCPRCRMETNMLDTIVRQVLAGNGNAKMLGQVDGLVKLAAGQGICTLIDMPVAPLKTALALFADEFTAHIEHRCPHCGEQDA